MISTTSEHFNEIIADLRYAKEFKTPYVLFTTDGQCIGYGESFSYIKCELTRGTDCYLRGVILETKKFAKLLKEVDENPQAFDIEQVPLKWITPIDGVNMTLGLSPNYIEYHIKQVLEEIRTMPPDEGMVLDKTDEFMEKYKALKADDGVVNLTMYDKYFIPLHKKLVPIVSTDNVRVSIRTRDELCYFYTLIYVTSKKGFVHLITIKLLKV